MSDVNKDEPGTPWTPPRTPPRTPSDQAQVEDVSQDTARNNGRNLGENTPRVSLSQGDEDPRVIIKDLEENTPRTSLSPRVCTRNLEENTPRIPLNLTVDEHRDPRVTTSPATSTPGSSPIGSSSGELRDSELQCSEESVIETSVTIEGNKKEDETEEIVFVRMINTTLTGNSEVEDESQDVEDTSWETTLEDTVLQERGAISCVAHRTRSHTEEMRKLNLTQLMGGCSLSLEESFEIIEPKAADSLSLPRPNKDEPEMENIRDWCGKLQIVDISMDKVSKIRGPQK